LRRSGLGWVWRRDCWGRAISLKGMVAIEESSRVFRWADIIRIIQSMFQTFIMITFTPEIETLIQMQLQSGRYTTQEEVVLAGLQLLEHRDSIYQGRFEELRQEVLIGVEEADRGELVDGDVVFQQLRDRLEQRRNQTSS
jgi:antitoxin ParD1/3/4